MPVEEQKKTENVIHNKVMWLYYIFTLLFMTTIMLNFMIAVIMDTYDRVTLIEDRYKYQGRAMLNFDFYEIKRFFTKCLKKSEYRLIIFSDSKEINNEKNYNATSDISDEINKHIKSQQSQSDVYKKVQLVEMQIKNQL